MTCHNGLINDPSSRTNRHLSLVTYVRTFPTVKVPQGDMRKEVRMRLEKRQRKAITAAKKQERKTEKGTKTKITKIIVAKTDITNNIESNKKMIHGQKFYNAL